jgi:hypothetical protein
MILLNHIGIIMLEQSHQLPNGRVDQYLNGLIFNHNVYLYMYETTHKTYITGRHQFQVV